MNYSPALEWAQQSARVWALCSGEASAQAWVSGEEEEQLPVKPQGVHSNFKMNYSPVSWAAERARS